jgi:hypothetical protein
MLFIHGQTGHCLQPRHGKLEDLQRFLCSAISYVGLDSSHLELVKSHVVLFEYCR